MTKTYKRAINIFVNRSTKIRERTKGMDYLDFLDYIRNELNLLYQYINYDQIIYDDKDELNYLKVRYLIEKFNHYYDRCPSYINRYRLTFIYIHIFTLVIIQSLRQNKQTNI